MPGRLLRAGTPTKRDSGPTHPPPADRALAPLQGDQRLVLAAQPHEEEDADPARGDDEGDRPRPAAAERSSATKLARIGAGSCTAARRDGAARLRRRSGQQEAQRTRRRCRCTDVSRAVEARAAAIQLRRPVGLRGTRTAWSKAGGREVNTRILRRVAPAVSGRSGTRTKKFTEPVALSSTEPVGLSASALRPSGAASTYLRSVLGARGKLVSRPTAVARGSRKRRAQFATNFT